VIAVKANHLSTISSHTSVHWQFYVWYSICG